MCRQILRLGCSLVSVAFLSGLAACSGSNKSHTDGGQLDSKNPPPDTGPGCAGDPKATYVLVEDMETTDHGPIDLDAGISPPLVAGYWYNSGAGYTADSGVGMDDTSNPMQRSFTFTALPTPTQTLNCNESKHAARQFCVLNGLYDTCGVGFEFAQTPDDAGVAPSNAGVGGAGDAGPSIPRTTIPFDISRYRAFTFWGMTTTPDPTTGWLAVKVQLPDTDTDPRGEVCNGGGNNTSKCYNSYAQNLHFTTSWQQFTVLLDAGGDGGVAPADGIAIDPTWGYQQAQWIPTQVYGINWQAQRNIDPTAVPPLKTEIWVDDVYFIE